MKDEKLSDDEKFVSLDIKNMYLSLRNNDVLSEIKNRTNDNKFVTIGVVVVAPWCSGLCRCGVVVTTTAQLHSTKPELRFCAGSNPARGVSEIRDGENLWQWSRLEIRLETFRAKCFDRTGYIIITIYLVYYW